MIYFALKMKKIAAWELPMVDRRNKMGQAMVEMALLLPLVLVILACMLQLLLVIHMHMKLHRSALMMAEQLAMGQSVPVLKAAALVEYRHTLRWGIPIPSVRTEKLEPWRKYNGYKTATATNCMAVAELSYPLFGSWYASVGIAPVILRAHAELPCEPQDTGTPS